MIVKSIVVALLLSGGAFFGILFMSHWIMIVGLLAIVAMTEA